MLTETSFSIDTSDGKQIYGLIHRPDQPTSSVIVLVHGLTGSMNEYIHITLAQFLTEKGYAVVRFNQYGGEQKARVFHEATISLHVLDTKRVIDYVQSLGFTKIVLAGHSLGSPVAIAATDSAIHSLILLDPTGPPKERIKDWQTYDAKHGISYLDWGLRIILGEQWIADAKVFPDSYDQFAKIVCPVHIIAAAQAEQMVYCKRYKEAHSSKPEIQVIPRATHCFTEDGTAKALGLAIDDWLKQST